MPFEKLPNQEPNQEQRKKELLELGAEERELREKIKNEMMWMFAIRYDLIMGMYDKLRTRGIGETATLTEGYATSAPELDKEAKQELRGASPNVSYFLKTSAGGPKSKYGDRNEDAFFLDIKKKIGYEDSDEETMGIFDGMGGMGNGVLASRIAVATGLRHITYGGVKDFEKISKAISREINTYGLGGAATGVIAHFEDSAKEFSPKMGGGRYVNIMAAGGTKALTIRNGEVFQEGTTVLQNVAFEY